MTIFHLTFLNYLSGSSTTITKQKKSTKLVRTDNNMTLTKKQNKNVIETLESKWSHQSIEERSYGVTPQTSGKGSLFCIAPIKLKVKETRVHMYSVSKAALTKTQTNLTLKLQCVAFFFFYIIKSLAKLFDSLV